MAENYEQDQVQTWLNDIEEALDLDEKLFVRAETPDDQEFVARHYDEAISIIEEENELTDDAAYALEVAHERIYNSDLYRFINEEPFK